MVEVDHSATNVPASIC